MDTLLKVEKSTEFDDRSERDQNGDYSYIYVGRDYEFSYDGSLRIFVRVYDRSYPTRSPHEAYLMKTSKAIITKTMIDQPAIDETIKFLHGLGVTDFFVNSVATGSYEKL